MQMILWLFILYDIYSLYADIKKLCTEESSTIRNIYVYTLAIPYYTSDFCTMQSKSFMYI